MTKKTIGIVGLGLIGASIGLDLCKKGYPVLGVSRNPQTCAQAIIKGVCQQASTEVVLLQEAEVIFLCTPIATIVPSLESLLPWLSTQTIVTDVGSVKTTIVEKCSALWTNFVGGHPMAGTANHGIDAAQENLFQAAPYVLTPLASTPCWAVECLKQIINEELESKVYLTTPETHDQAVAWISHLPVIVSAGLLSAVLTKAEPNILVLAKQLASSGFRDTSRVGGGNPELGVMMASYNRSALLSSLVNYRQVLDKIIDLIEAEDWQTLQDILTLTQQTRPEFLLNLTR